MGFWCLVPVSLWRAEERLEPTARDIHAQENKCEQVTFTKLTRAANATGEAIRGRPIRIALDREKAHGAQGRAVHVFAIVTKRRARPDTYLELT